MAEPIPLDPADSIVWSARLDAFDEDTLEPPPRNEIASIGSLTDKLSDISSCIEKEMEYRKSEGRCKDFIHRFLRLLRGPVMWFLTIANFLFCLVTIIMCIVIIVLALQYRARAMEYNDLKRDQSNAACSVIWSEWSECSAACTDRHNDDYDLPNSTRRILYCYGKCGNANSDGGCNITSGLNRDMMKDFVHCNLHSCKLPGE